MVWTKETENRIAVVGKLDGDDSKDERREEFGLTGRPREIPKEILRLVEFGKIARNNAVGMTVEME